MEVVVLLRDQRSPCTCHHTSLRLCIKGKWRTLASKSAAKNRLGGGGKKKSKEEKGKRKTPLSIHSIGTEEDTTFGSVIL